MKLCLFSIVLLITVNLSTSLAQDYTQIDGIQEGDSFQLTVFTVTSQSLVGQSATLHPLIDQKHRGMILEYMVEDIGEQTIPLITLSVSTNENIPRTGSFVSAFHLLTFEQIWETSESYYLYPQFAVLKDWNTYYLNISDNGDTWLSQYSDWFNDFTVVNGEIDFIYSYKYTKNITNFEGEFVQTYSQEAVYYKDSGIIKSYKTIIESSNFYSELYLTNVKFKTIEDGFTIDPYFIIFFASMIFIFIAIRYRKSRVK